MPPRSHRIVSLLPAATEIVCALGLGHELKGRSHECDFPPGVEALPACTRSNIKDASSREIDREVGSRVNAGLSLYDVDTEALGALLPTCVVTQDQCDVCAVSLESVEAALKDRIASKPLLLSLSPRTLGDVFSDILRVGEALGVYAEAKALVRTYSDRVAAIAERTGSLEKRPRVACLEWLDPLMGSANWIPELVILAGGEPVFGVTGEASMRLAPQQLLKANPDVIVLLPCGFDCTRTRSEAPGLWRIPGFEKLGAVREGRIRIVDGNAYFNRPGPRLVESLEILAEILHPELFDFGHQHRGWEPLENQH